MYEYYTFLFIDVFLKHVGGFMLMDNLTVSFCASVCVYQWLQAQRTAWILLNYLCLCWMCIRKLQ